MDLVEYLASKGVSTYRAAGSEVTAHCFFCPDGNPKGKGKLYLNVAEGLYHCKRCDESGNAKTLMRHFGDTPDVAELPGQDPTARRRVLEAATAFCVEQLHARDEILTYLLSSGETKYGPGRGLSVETILARRYGWSSRSWSLRDHLLDLGHKLADIRSANLLNHADDDFYRDRLMIPYVTRTAVVQLRGKELGGKYFTGPGDAVRLYNADALGGPDGPATEVVITEGEFDAALLEQTLALSPDARHRAIACVGLAGVQSLPEGLEGYLSQARKVYLGFDPDEPGRKGAVKVKELLGSKARIVELPDELPKKDWTELITRHGWTYRECVRALGNATGKRLFSVGDAAERLRVQRATSDGLKLGYGALDAAIAPGLLPGQVMGFLAKPGAGKTVLLCNLAYQLRSRHVLYVTLEMTQEEVYERLRRIYLFHWPHANEHEIEDAMARLRIVDENRLAPGDLTALVEEYAEDVGARPEVVFVDYLQYYARGFPGDAYARVSDAVMQLKAEAKGGRFAVIVPSQVNRGVAEGKPIDLDDARDSGVIEETCDFLLSIYRPEDAVEQSPGVERPASSKLRMGLLKSRHGGKGKQIQLIASAASLAIVDDNTRAARRAADENALVNRGISYERIRAQQSRPDQPRLALA